MDKLALTYRNWPFYWLVRATGRYLHNIEMALKPHELDVPQWRVLMCLHEEGCMGVGEIADHAMSKLSTMTKIVQRMQADGLVVCRPRGTDARVTEVLLTDEGRNAAAQAWQTAFAVYEKAFGRMSGREIDTLNKLLMKLAGNLQP